MRLVVEYEGFVAAARRHGGAVAYCHASCGFVTATSVGSLIVTTRRAGSLDQVAADIEAQGLPCERGRVLAEGEQNSPSIWIAAVAYRASGGAPGVWVEVYPQEPTESQALRDLFEEFTRHEIVGEEDFERFLEIGQPTVALVSPLEIERYLTRE